MKRHKKEWKTMISVIRKNSDVEVGNLGGAAQTYFKRLNREGFFTERMTFKLRLEI